MSVSNYRKALGFTQKEMADKFEISAQAYYRKEKGYVPFNDKEKLVLREMFRKLIPEITIDDIFFSSECKEIQRKEVE